MTALTIFCYIFVLVLLIVGWIYEEIQNKKKPKNIIYSKIGLISYAIGFIITIIKLNIISENKPKLLTEYTTFLICSLISLTIFLIFLGIHETTNKRNK